MNPILTSIVSAVSTFIPKLMEIVGKNLIQVVNIIIGIVKGLGIVQPEENATDLGDKALQAEEAGITPENYDSYEEYLKAVEKFETNPKRSAKIDENEKLQKGAEIITATLIENADSIRNKNVEYILKDRLKAKISIDEILIRAIIALVENKALHLKNGKLENNSYSLLAYNVEQEKYYA